ncbi:MAG: hypothetical protein GQ549_04785 [Gammaproteobacteria bacterium]|nr:hypothetical protein [Gammaproteobacteria bacterium]
MKHADTNPAIISRKQIIVVVIFTALALFLSSPLPTVEIVWVSTILVLAIYLFAFEEEFKMNKESKDE